MRTPTPPRRPRHECSRRFSPGLIFGQVVPAAYAAPTPLADVPIAAKVAAKPNIVYTFDDSGSMQYNYLPDFVVNAGGDRCR